MSTATSGRLYVGEEMLGYRAIRRCFGSGERLTLDDAYRVAHLPLVAPMHPDVIRRASDGSYCDGGYAAPRFSLVLPIDADLLDTSSAFRRLNTAMSASRCAGKIAWSVMQQRRHRLHVTLCGGLAADELGAVAEGVRSCSLRIGPMRVRIGGPLIAKRNVGRVYFAAYPEQRVEGNVFHRIQRAAGRPTTDLYLLGYYNLTDHLSAKETAEFAAIIADASSSQMMVCATRSLWIMQTNDDLELSAVVRDEIAWPGDE